MPTPTSPACDMPSLTDSLLESKQPALAKAVSILRELGVPLSPAQSLVLDRLKLQKHMNATGPSSSNTSTQGMGRRGILVPAGGTDMLASAYILVRGLREIAGVDMDIEVVYHSSRELDVDIARQLTAIKGVKLIDGDTVEYPAHHQPVRGRVREGAPLVINYICDDD